MMGLANDDFNEGICIHLPLSALSEVATLLFTDRDRDTYIYVHSLKQLINWFYKHNILISNDYFQDVSIAAYLLKPPEKDKGEDWQEFLLSSLVRDRLGQEYPFLPRQVERDGYPEALYDRLREDACSVWELGKSLFLNFRPIPCSIACTVMWRCLSFLCWPRWKETALELTCLRSAGLGPEWKLRACSFAESSPRHTDKR